MSTFISTLSMTQNKKLNILFIINILTFIYYSEYKQYYYIINTIQYYILYII